MTREHYQGNILASNGSIHTIYTVLTLPDTILGDVVSVALGSPEFSDLVAVLTKTDQEKRPVTCRTDRRFFVKILVVIIQTNLINPTNPVITVVKRWLCKYIFLNGDVTVINSDIECASNER